MDLRRAVLLFAVLLGLAAVAASLSSPTGERRDAAGERAAPSRPPAPAALAEPRELRFDARSDAIVRRAVAAGEHAVVTVAVDEPGQVEIEGLGLLQAAEPGTPAVFDVLATEPGRHAIAFTPVEGAARRVGTLRVEPPPPRRR